MLLGRNILEAMQKAGIPVAPHPMSQDVSVESREE